MTLHDADPLRNSVQTIQVRALNVAYLEQGEGPLVLCLHGYPDTAHSWIETLRYLAARGYRAVAPFMRGYYPTDISADGDYTVQQLARDVLARDAFSGPYQYVFLQGVGHFLHREAPDQFFEHLSAFLDQRETA